MAPLRREIEANSKIRDASKVASDKLQRELGEKIAVLNTELDAIRDELVTATHAKEVIEASVTLLNTQKLDLTSEITVAGRHLVDVIAANTVAKAEYDQLSHDNEDLNASVGGLTIQKQALEREIATLTLDNNVKTKDMEQKLAIVTLKLTESVRALTDTQHNEENIRTELATRQMALDKREDVLVGRENALKMHETRVYNYAKSMNI